MESNRSEHVRAVQVGFKVEVSKCNNVPYIDKVLLDQDMQYQLCKSIA
jgi:hypothetical protein